MSEGVPPVAGSGPELTPEEQEKLARQLAEEFRRIRVEDLVVQTLVTVSSIGYRRLGLTEDTRADRDLDQTRFAIETMRALTPVLERFIPAELVRDFNQSVANLQLAYAKAATDLEHEATGEEPARGAPSGSPVADAATPAEGASEEASPNPAAGDDPEDVPPEAARENAREGQPERESGDG